VQEDSKAFVAALSREAGMPHVPEEVALEFQRLIGEVQEFDTWLEELRDRVLSVGGVANVVVPRSTDRATTGAGGNGGNNAGVGSYATATGKVATAGVKEMMKETSPYRILGRKLYASIAACHKVLARFCLRNPTNQVPRSIRMCRWVGGGRC